MFKRVVLTLCVLFCSITTALAAVTNVRLQTPVPNSRIIVCLVAQNAPPAWPGMAMFQLDNNPATSFPLTRSFVTGNVPIVISLYTDTGALITRRTYSYGVPVVVGFNGVNWTLN